MEDHGIALALGALFLLTIFAPIASMPVTEQSDYDLASAVQPQAVPEYMNYLSINNLRFDPVRETPTLPESLSYGNLPGDISTYQIIQFNRPVTPAMKTSLESTGVKILHYISYNAFVVRADGRSLEVAKELSSVRWAGTFEPAYKISPRLSESYDKILKQAEENAMPLDSTVADVIEKYAVSSERAGTYSDSYPGKTSPEPSTLRGQRDYARLPTLAESVIQIEVMTFEDSGVIEVAESLETLGAKDIIYSHSDSGILRATIDRAQIESLARVPNVMWIDRYVQPRLYNDIARWVIQSGNGTTYSTPIHDEGVWGTNQTVTVCDSGIDYQHDAFEDPSWPSPNAAHRKVTDYYVPPGGGGDYSDNGINHGTHVSGTVAGDDGTWHVYDGDPLASSGSAGPHDGQAFDAKIQMQDLSPDGYWVYPPSDYHVLFQEAVNRGSYIHTNSWGGDSGSYVPECEAIDDFIWDNQDMIVLWAAGNPGSYPGGVSSYSGSKNSISVGATLNGVYREDMADFSGRGPMSDGRIKPDVTTPGVDIWSAHGGDPGGVYDDYFTLSGTSMATPQCAGAVTLIRQYYMDGFYPTGSRQPVTGFTPSAALVKATLINSGQEMTGFGAYINGETRYPNYNQGWGRVTLDDALYFKGESRGLSIRDERLGIDTGETVQYGFGIGSASEPVEITLVWSDYPGMPYSNPNLVNDLDLVVVAPDGTEYHGNRYVGYNPGESYPNPNGTDHINNVECVLVLTPQPGVWSVRIVGFNVPQGPQSFAIVVTGIIATQMGSVQFDQNSYRSDATAVVTVVDTDLDQNPNATDSYIVNVTSTTEPIPEFLTVTETGASTSVFVGAIMVDNNAAPILGDGKIQVQNGDIMIVAYFDWDDGMGGSGEVTDSAVVDDDPPVISNVQVSSLRFNRATVTWETDEASDSWIYWGDSIPPTNSKGDPRRLESHSIRLSSLTENTTYYFAVESTDAPGNTAYDDNGSAYYSFTTPEIPPTPPANTDWPTFHNNNVRQGVSPASFSPPLELMWSTNGYMGDLWTSPAFVHGFVYTTTADGAIRARDAYTGDLLWSRTLGSTWYYTCSPVVEEGVTYVSFMTESPSGEIGTVYALDALTGDTIWSAGPAETGISMISARCALAVDDGLLFGYSWDGSAFALNTDDGSVEWVASTGAYSLQGPALGMGMVFLSLENGQMVALDEYSGDLVWQTALDSMCVGVPLVAQDCVYMGTYEGAMYCLDAYTGTILWQQPGLGEFYMTTPAYDGSSIFFGTRGSTFYSLDASNGDVIWQTPLSAGIESSAAYAAGCLYVPAWDGTLKVLDALDGSVIDTEMLYSGSASSPAISDGWVWLQDYNGSMYAYLGQLPVGLTVSPAVQRRDASVPSAIDFRVTVTNRGISGPDTFDLTVALGALGWSVSLYEADGSTPLTDTDGDTTVDTGPMASSASKEVVIRVDVPLGALAGDSETSIVTFTSSKDPAVWKNAAVTTDIRYPGVEIWPNAYFAPSPGETLMAWTNVRNPGGFPDTIDIAAFSPSGWTLALYGPDGSTPLVDTDGDMVVDVGELPGTSSTSFVVEIQVPLSLMPGTLERVELMGTSSLDPTKHDTVFVTIESEKLPSDEWPTFQNEIARRGVSPSIFSPPLELEWISPYTFDTFWGSPAVADGMLFVCSSDGYLRARNPDNGALIWQKQLGDEYYYTSTPNVYEGAVYVVFSGAMGGTYYALDEYTGDILWSVGPSSGMSIAARVEKAVEFDLVFGSAWTGEIFALDAEDGSIVWTRDTGYTPTGGMAIGGGMLFMPTDTGNLLALDMFSGSLAWEASMDEGTSCTPMYAEGKVYVASGSGTMYAFDSVTGDEIWTVSESSWFYQVAAAYDGSRVFIGDESGYMHAYNSFDGEPLWSKYLGMWIESSPVLANGYLYCVDGGGDMHVLNPATGAQIYAYDIGEYSVSSPAVSDGWVWVSNVRGEIHAFRGVMSVGVKVQPSYQQRDVLPDTVEDYYLNLTNIGSLPSDRYEITLAQGTNGWPVDVLNASSGTPFVDTDADGVPDTGPMSSGAMARVLVRVTIPSGAAAGDDEIDGITFTSDNDPTISKTATVRSTVPPPGVDIGPRTYISANSGDTVQTLMYVINTGGLPDTIDVVAFSTLGWTVNLYEMDGVTPLIDHDGDMIPDVGELIGLQSTNITVEIMVPGSESPGALDRTIVTGISSIDPLVWDSEAVVVEISVPANHEWPTFHNNEARVGRSPSPLCPPLMYMWSAGPYEGEGYSSPILDNGILFHTTIDGYLRARDPHSGVLIWEKQLGGYGEYTGTPTAEEGVIYVTFSDNMTGSRVFALDEQTGDILWQVGPETGMEFNWFTTIEASDGLVFGGAWTGEAYALNATDGSVVWTFNEGSPSLAGPAVVAGMIFMNFLDGTVVALDELTGALVWSRVLDDVSTSCPMFARGNIYVGTYSGSMYALDAFTGDLSWQTYTYGMIDSSTPAYDGTNVYFASNGRYFALDAENGALVWQTSMGLYTYSSLAYASGYLYGTCTQGHLLVIRASDGLYVGGYWLGYSSTSSPAISDGWLWVENSAGEIFGFMGSSPASVIVSPASQSGDGLPNKYVGYTVEVLNLGTLPSDTFDATIAPGILGWDVELYESDGVTPLNDSDSDGIPDTGPLGQWEDARVVVRVYIPSEFNVSDTEATVVTFTSSNDPNVWGDAELITTISPPGATVGPRTFMILNPGDRAVAHMNVTNTGPFNDTFDLTALSDHGWDVGLFEEDGVTPLPDTDGDMIPDTGVVMSDRIRGIVIKVDVPAGAPLGTFDTTRVVARSSLDPNQSGGSAVSIQLGAVTSSDWPTALHDSARTGVNPMPWELPLTEVWSSGYGSMISWYGAAIHNGLAIYADMSQTVYALDIMTGALVWSTALAPYEGYAGAPTAAYGCVYVVIDSWSDGTSTLFCLDELTGEIVWQSDELPGSGAEYTVPAIGSGVVYWSTYVDGYVYAHDALTGELLWSYQAPSWASDGPTYWAGMVFIGDAAGNVFALDADTGAQIWSDNVYYTVYSMPVVSEGMLLICNEEGFVEAYEATTGAVLWVSGDLGYYIYPFTPILADGLVFVGSAGPDWYTIYALDADSGDIEWEFDTGGPYVTVTAAYCNGILYAMLDNGTLLALDGVTGKPVLWLEISPGAYLSSSVSLGDGYLVVGDNNGSVYCFEFAGLSQVTRVEIDPMSATLDAGGATVFNATAYDAAGRVMRNVVFNWTSVNGLGEIVAVTENGATIVYVAGPIAGDDMLQVNCSGVLENASIAIVPTSIDHIVVSPADAYVTVGETQQFTAAAYDRYGNEIAGLTFVWSVYGSIGTIDSSGLLTASTSVASGMVSATYDSWEGLAEVDVGAGPLASLEAMPSEINMPVDTTTTIQVKGLDQYGNEISGLTFAWAADIGTLTPTDGFAVFSSGTTAGYGNISVSSGSLTFYIPVHVVPGQLVQIALAPSHAVVVVGMQQTFTATPMDAYGNVISGLTLSWSADVAIGAIDQAGVLTAATVVANGDVIVACGAVQATASVALAPDVLDHIDISPSSLAISAGQVTSMNAIGLDQHNNVIGGLTFSWSAIRGSTKPLNAEASWAEYIAPTLAGPDWINVSSGSVTIQVLVDVAPGPLAKLTVSPASVTVTVGTTQAFTAVGTDVYGNVISGLTLTWSESGGIGAITQTGVLTASTATGSGSVTASSGSVTGAARVTIVPGALVSITVSKVSPPYSVMVNSSASMLAVGRDVYGNELTGLGFQWSANAGSIHWTSAYPSYITYTAPTAAGTYTVTAGVGSINGSTTITVIPGALSALAISPATTTIAAGGSASFTVQATDVYGNVLSGLSITWSASAGSIGASGAFAAPTTVGRVTVAATSGSVLGQATVTVVPAALDRIVVSENSLDLKTGEAASLTVMAYDQYNNEIHGLTFNWSATIGSVHPSGDTYGAAFATGEKAGKGTITVSTGGENETVSVTISESSLSLGRQLMQPTSLMFLVIAIALALLLMLILMKGGKLFGRKGGEEPGEK